MDFAKGKGAQMCVQGLELRARTKVVPACLGVASVGAVPVGYPWEVRAKQVVQCSEVSQSFIPSRGGGGLWKFSQQEREGEEASEDA